MSGFPGNLSDSQKEKLRKFKENVADVLKPEHDDVLLLKFLRARKFDLKRTEKMLKMDIKWREENKVSTIFDWYKIPERGLKHTEGSLMIFDMENLGVHHLWKPAIDMFIKTAVIAEQHYPELIYRLFIIRAPKIFPVTYSLVKPFLREDTRKKIQVLGSNWKEVLLKQIDPDQLPVYWGGTKTDPDGNEMCTSLIRVGGKIPKSFYLKDREPPHTLTTHEVSRGGVIEFKYEVKNANSVMRYEFQTDCSDIKFGFDLVDAKGKKTAILKLEKYNSHMVPENGELMIAEPGTYVARFDNSHSWTKSKKLSYWLELLEPSDVEPEFQEMVEGADSMNLND
ncbi:SEC14-like protein 2 [Strongylocentrotus purpuratus]|uniref:SEC14-like protein 2 n=1 Tax=Strongylocentrotus purpuratus TaxID=7668 RepID=A0A7M7T1F5_STRPU|nr:SEC14-like protein 2 [Strongylocentrotus purpuratus]